MTEIVLPLEETPQNASTTTGGALIDSLYRNPKQIKRDRANSINDDLEIVYRRKIEDLKNDQRRLLRSQAAMLDLSADDSTSLLLAKNFDPDSFLNQDASIGLQVRELEIKIEILSKRYVYLFNKTI